MSDAEALEWALDAARAAAAQATWFRPAAGAPDPQLLTRHDVRAAAQAVLAQLELIGIAWPAWDAVTRSEMLGELEESTRQLVDQSERFSSSAS